MKNTWWVKKGDLIDEQADVVELPPDGSFLVLGPPGSGKTNLLLLRAAYLIFASRSNLAIVVFNRPLQEFIRAGASQYGVPPSRIQTLLGWERSILKEYGISENVSGSFPQQRASLYSRLHALVEERQLSDLFEVVLLDEAQDYTPEEIQLFRQLSNDLFITADSRQKIYDGRDSVPVAKTLVSKVVTLKHHFRNGINICKLADAIAKDRDDYEPMEATSNYDELKNPSTVEVHCHDDLESQIKKALSSLDLQFKAYPGEVIGIACPRKNDVARVWEAVSQGPYAKDAILQQFGDYAPFAAKTNLCVSTCHGMKGLEFRALHILGADKLAGMSRRKNLAFTAVTRAKTSLDLYYSGSLPSFLDGAVSKLKPATELPTLDILFGEDN